MDGEEVVKVDDFKYLRLAVQSNRWCKREGKMRVQAEWSRWRKLSEMIYDRRITA